MLKKIAVSVVILILALAGFLYYSEWDFKKRAPEIFSKPNADTAARKHLVKYAEEFNVPFEEFKGPYFKSSLTLDFPTYLVCYEHPKHYFCYDHWTENISKSPLKKGEEQPRDYTSPEYEGL